ncbi:MAG: hypothetical protein HZA50_00950 [Planctomycetes bacterium]|nr:hypothetical protein [Planctomycetota bacterium]
MKFYAPEGGLGMELDLAAVPTDGSLTVPKTLFSESAGRFLVEVAPRNYDALLRIVRDCPFGELGKLNESGKLVVRAGGRNIIDLPLTDAKAAWQKTFAAW